MPSFTMNPALPEIVPAVGRNIEPFTIKIKPQAELNFIWSVIRLNLSAQSGELKAQLQGRQWCYKDSCWDLPMGALAWLTVHR
jgi:hypothetical protein